jgi:hypothetical protein
VVSEARVSGWGSVCERGVEGLREDMLSSDVLLSWRASVLLSPMASAAAGWLELEGDASCIAGFVASGALFGLLSDIGPVWGLAVGMDLTRWSWCRSSFTFSGGERFEAVMAAVCEYT